METTRLNILAVGRDEAILAVVERLINSHDGWVAAIAMTEAEAEGLFRTTAFSIVLVGAGFSAQEEETLRQRLLKLDPAVTVIRHYGGGSGLLENEILGIIQSKQHAK
jgi:hypothetical protein